MDVTRIISFQALNKNGKRGSTFTLSVPAGSTIAQVKTLVMRHEGLNYSQFVRLIWKGRILNEKALVDQIPEGTTLSFSIGQVGSGDLCALNFAQPVDKWNTSPEVEELVGRGVNRSQACQIMRLFQGDMEMANGFLELSQTHTRPDGKHHLYSLRRVLLQYPKSLEYLVREFGAGNPIAQDFCRNFPEAAALNVELDPRLFDCDLVRNGRVSLEDASVPNPRDSKLPLSPAVRVLGCLPRFLEVADVNRVRGILFDTGAEKIPDALLLNPFSAHEREEILNVKSNGDWCLADVVALYEAVGRDADEAVMTLLNWVTLD